MQNLLDEIKHRNDDGQRFHRDIFVNNEYAYIGERSAKVVIDIGANIGCFSYYMYDKAEIIYAIEADLDNFNDLKHYVEKYQIHKIKPFYLAIAGSNGERPLYVHSSSGSYSIAIASEKIARNVETKTLHTFMVENHIEHVDIMKIDVEGAEEEIFNASDFSQAATKINYIIGENHLRNIQDVLLQNMFTFEQYPPRCVPGHPTFIAYKRD